MPYLIDSRSRSGVLIDTINHLIAQDGPCRLSLRRIAKESGVSPGSMMDHFGNKARLLQLSSTVTARARQDDITARMSVEGALAFLPATHEQVPDYRIWLAWQELSRSVAAVRDGLERARTSEREILRHATALEGERLEAAYALVDGLTVALCAPTDPMPVDRARHLLAAHLQQAELRTERLAL